MIKKTYLPLFMVASALTFSSVSPIFTLKAETLAATSSSQIPWQSHMDASWLDPNKPIIALTFDDGPVWTGSSASDILDVLEAYNAHATFFYCGVNISNTTKSEIARSFALGNEIGNHTTDHLDLTGMSADKITYEINSTADLLTEITGLHDFLVRTPYCSSNETIFNTIPTPLISAALDSKDYLGLSTEEIIDNVLTQAADGAIVLMHEPLSTTSEAVKVIVPELIKRGYQIASVSEMMTAKGITMTSGQVYTHTPIPSNLTTHLEGAAITYQVASEWPGNYMGEISITNTSNKPISNWTLDFDFSDTISAVYGGTLKLQNNNHATVSAGGWSTTIMPGETAKFTLAVAATTCMPKIPSNFTLTLEDGTILNSSNEDTNNKQETSDSTTTDDKQENSGSITDDKQENSGSTTDNKQENSDSTTDDKQEDSDSTTDDKQETQNSLAVTSNINSWGTGYTCNLKVTNISDTLLNTWSFKVLKSDFDITNSWGCTITEDGDYLIISPASYNAVLSPKASIEFGIQGNGNLNPNFTVLYN